MTLRSLTEIVTRARRGQAIGLLAIGISMFACSDLIESKAPAGFDLEFAYAIVIVLGLVATILVFRRPETSGHERSGELNMPNGFFTFRPGPPKTFRGVRLFLYLLFWMFCAVMVLGVITEMLSSR